MPRYEIIIYWSNEDAAYIAEVPELPGCMAHGHTPESAAANANDAIQLWIDTAKESVDPHPEPTGQREYPLRGQPIKYVEPTDPVAQADWDAIQ